MSDPDLLARIRKCLALGRSANEHEAAAALSKARALMDAHGLTDSDVALSEVWEASVKGSGAQRPSAWEEVLCMTVRRMVGVDVVLGSDLKRIYIGVGAAPAIATYAFAVLFRKLKAARRDYIRSHLKCCSVARKRQRADAFCEAWAVSVHRQVAALMPKSAPNDLVGQYIARRFGSLSTIDPRAASTKGRSTERDRWNGMDAGRDVELNAGVGTSSGSQRLLA